MNKNYYLKCIDQFKRELHPYMIPEDEYDYKTDFEGIYGPYELEHPNEGYNSYMLYMNMQCKYKADLVDNILIKSEMEPPYFLVILDKTSVIICKAILV